MIFPYSTKRFYPIVYECHKKVAEVNSSLTDATFETLKTNQSYCLHLPVYLNDATYLYWRCVSSFMDTERANRESSVDATLDGLKAGQLFLLGILTYLHDFMIPYWTAANAFTALEKKKRLETPPLETMLDYLELMQFNLQVAEKGLTGSVKSLHDYSLREGAEALQALTNTFLDREGVNLKDYTARQARQLDMLVYGYPEAIRAIKADYGFHFDNGGYKKAAETDRFILYQVLPQDKRIKVRKQGKPIVILPPYVLGPNVLALLPGERKSYVHAYANQGIPTYIRVMKDIETTPAVQSMTGEDDAIDTKFFCERVMQAHGRSVTLNGFCQGGFMAVLNILSGELDGLVDALITCVAPMDGTRSLALVEYMQHLPSRFRDLGYAVKDMPSGHRIVDGKVMSWVYKLKSMEKEFSLVTLYRDLMNLETTEGMEIKISSTAAAMNHWLIYDRNDLPEGITKLSFDSYTIPVEKDGTLPVKLFGKKLNFKGIQRKGIKWLLCYAQKDDLVDQAAAVAPLDFVDAEVAVFPKGHGAIATSWSHPDTECALHKRFGPYRGPVRFQLDLEEAGNL
ncbi:MAG: metal transporter [Syntrophus sp. (in: bacteria)]|nr:metal transporter [Syntrophus sp. (in: bacteria)]